MKKNKSNLLQKKNASYKKYTTNKKNNYFKISDKKNNGVKYIEDKMKNNKNVRIVEITPRISSANISDKNLDFEKKVELLVQELKETILRLHKEGNSIRFIAGKVGISRELVRKVIKGEGTLKITAMQRIRAQEMQQMKF